MSDGRRGWRSAWRPIDAAAIVGVVVAAYHEAAGRLRGGDYVDLGNAGDWIAHAYRSQLVSSYQLTSWDPAWSRGYPNTDGWQELPDVITGLIARTGHLGIPHTMVLLTFACLLAYPVGGYVAVRLLGGRPLAGLLGAAALIDNPALYAFVGDYSGIFGLVALPLAVWIVLDCFGRRAGWLGAVAIGVLIELHPFAAVAAGALLLVRLAYDRGADIGRIVAQSAVTLAVAAPYWLTLLTFARPNASDTGTEASLPFAQSHLYLHVGVAELSVFVIALTLVAIVAVALRWLPDPRQTVCCLGAAAVMGGAVALSYQGWMPKLVMEAQFTRSIPFIVVLLAMGVAPLADLFPAALTRVRPLAARGARAVAAASAVVAVGTALVLASDGGRWTHEYLAQVVPDAYPGGHDIAAFLAGRPDIPRPAVFFTDYTSVAAGSFDAFGQVEFTGDYTARNWSFLHVAIASRFGPGIPFATIEPLLRDEGVGFIYVTDSTPAAAALDGWLNDGSLVLAFTGTAGRVAALAKPSPAAFAAPAATVRAGEFPDLAYYTDPTAAARLVPNANRWLSVVTGSSRPAAISVDTPSARRLTVDGHTGDILVTGQRWDASWEATVDGRALRTERVGPDLLGIDLDQSGTQTVVIRHHPSRGEEVALGLLAFAVVACAAGSILDRTAWTRLTVQDAGTGSA